MSATTAPTIRFKVSPKQKSFSWSCSCGQSLSMFKTERAATESAQSHSAWHGARSQPVTVELGGLL